MGGLPLVVRRDELRGLYETHESQGRELSDSRKRERDLERELKALRANAARALTALERGDDRTAASCMRDAVTNADRRLGSLASRFGALGRDQ